MITTLPVTTAEIVNAVLPRNAAAKGTVEKKIAQDVCLIALATGGKIAVKVPAGELSEGDGVALFSRGSSILIERIPPRQSGAPVPAADTVLLQNAPDSATLKLLADTAAEQLAKQVLDKDTLEQLKRILSAVAKNPSRFGADTVNAVAQLKAIVAAMPSEGADVAQTAQQIAGRIIDLGEKFAEKLKSGAGAVDVVLRNGTTAREGYYSFDNVKSAISWLSENKEIQENIPWQKLSSVFGSGPVVIKVYESAIGDMRASFVAPRQTADELSHFVASTLRADVWKTVSENVLTKVLYDRKEIPLSRLLEIDSLLKESEQQQPKPASAQPQESAEQSPAVQSKGFEAALSQWLTIALDSDAPLPQLVPRVPVQSSQQIPSLLSTLGTGQETASIAPVRADDFSIRQEALVSAQNPETVLPDLFMRLGLNLESALSRGDEAAADIHPQNLKAILLSLLGTIDDAAAKSTAAVTERVAVQQEKTVPAGPDVQPLQRVAAPDASRTAVQRAVSDVSTALEKVFNEAARQARSLSEQISRLTDNAGQVQNSPDAARQSPDKAAPAVLQKMPAQVDAAVQAMLKGAPEEVERLMQAFQNALDAVSAEQGRPDAGQGGNAFIKAVLREVSAQLAAESSKAVIALEQGRTVVADATAKFTAALSDRITALQEKTFIPSADAPAQAELARKQVSAMLGDVKQEIMAFAKEIAVSVEEMVGRPYAGLTAAQEELLDLISGLPALPDKGEPLDILPAPASRAMPGAETPEPVVSQVARNIGIAAKVLDILSAQAADESAAPVLLSAKQDLGRVLAEVNQAAGSPLETVPSQDNALSAAVNSNAAQLQSLAQGMKDAQALLVRQQLAGLDDVIGNLLKQVEQVPAISDTASRREAVSGLLSEFAATVSEKVDRLAREAGTQMSDFAEKSADIIETAASLQTGAVPASPAEQVDMMQMDSAPEASPVPAQLAKAAQDIQSVLVRLETAKGDTPARAEQIVRQLQKLIAQTADAFVSRAPGGPGDTQQRTDARPDAQPPQVRSEAARQFENLAAAAGRQIMAKVNDVAEKLQDLGRQVRQLQDALQKNSLSRDPVSQTNRQSDALQSSIKDAFRQLNSLAKTVYDQASSAAHDTARHLDNLASEASKQLDSAAGGRQHGPLDALKQEVENALTRVESLQVLARQVPVTDGQQQVISLPMKIEGQWTDVVVKFLKKKSSGGKDTAGKPVSVAVHVSPAMLGQIDVFMDYSGKKRFSMRMEFEKPSTRAWFENNKADFSAALGRIGFAAFKIDMKEIGRKRPHDGAVAAPKTGGTGLGIIDITA